MVVKNMFLMLQTTAYNSSVTDSFKSSKYRLKKRRPNQVKKNNNVIFMYMLAFTLQLMFM